MLDSNNTVPLYLQLKEALKEAIATNQYKHSDKLPTEPELCEKYNVSRITVRKAVTELCDEGILEKKQGKGTFVKQKKIQRKMEHLLSFSQACELNGMEPKTIVLNREVVNLDPKIAEEFSLEPKQKMIMIQRLRKADGIPIILENNYYPYERFKMLLDEDLDCSLYQLLENKYGIVIEASKSSSLDVVRATAADTKTLEISYGDPLFRMQTQIYDTDDELVHIGIEYIVCERYRFSLVDFYKDNHLKNKK